MSYATLHKVAAGYSAITQISPTCANPSQNPLQPCSWECCSHGSILQSWTRDRACLRAHRNEGGPLSAAQGDRLRGLVVIIVLIFIGGVITVKVWVLPGEHAGCGLVSSDIDIRRSCTHFRALQSFRE